MTRYGSFDKVHVVDNAVTDYELLRGLALKAQFFDYKAHDGETYRRVSGLPTASLWRAIERVYGTVASHGAGLRLNYDGELPNHLVHTDLGWGTHAAVLYLCDKGSGTAFFKHRPTGATKLKAANVDLLPELVKSWDVSEDWDVVQHVRLAPNRMVTYPSALFHGRYPFAASGTTPQGGRLVAVAFFTPVQEHL